ncbi:unnamed protein product [Protopolystoma xenopodis]|uniref:Uncharacterized protein n=1 Tax=Protopolystoma xenopodis TaxID=117903 RepID=A0A3S4ZH33_9PLAT|nr:unnamed protein product [Protopolystoma xenopodis]
MLKKLRNLKSGLSKNVIEVHLVEPRAQLQEESAYVHLNKSRSEPKAKYQAHYNSYFSVVFTLCIYRQNRSPTLLDDRVSVELRPASFASLPRRLSGSCGSQLTGQQGSVGLSHPGTGTSTTTSDSWQGAKRRLIIGGFGSTTGKGGGGGGSGGLGQGLAALCGLVEPVIGV